MIMRKTIITMNNNSQKKRNMRTSSSTDQRNMAKKNYQKNLIRLITFLKTRDVQNNFLTPLMSLTSFLHPKTLAPSVSRQHRPLVKWPECIIYPQKSLHLHQHQLINLKDYNLNAQHHIQKKRLQKRKKKP